MDNRSIAAFIETNRTKMNSVKVFAQERCGPRKTPKAMTPKVHGCLTPGKSRNEEKIHPSRDNELLTLIKSSTLKMLYQPPMQAWYIKIK